MKSLQVSAPGFAQRKLPPFLGAKVTAVVKNFAFTEGPLEVLGDREAVHEDEVRGLGLR